MQVSYMQEETRGADGAPLAALAKPQASPRKPKQGSANNHNGPEASRRLTNPSNLDTTVPVQGTNTTPIEVVATHVTASVPDKLDRPQSSLNRSLNHVSSSVRRAGSAPTATEAAVAVPDHNNGRDKITEASQQQECVVSIEEGSASWSKRSAVPGIHSKPWEKLTPAVKAHVEDVVSDGVEADQASSSNAERDSSSATAKTELPSEDAVTGCIRSVPLLALLGMTFMFSFWVMQAIKYDGSSGIAIPGVAAGLGKSDGGTAADGDSMTVRPEDDIQAAVRELRGRVSEDEQGGGWKRKRIVIGGIPGREPSGGGFTAFADDYLNATVVERDATI